MTVAFDFHTLSLTIKISSQSSEYQEATAARTRSKHLGNGVGRPEQGARFET